MVSLTTGCLTSRTCQLSPLPLLRSPAIASLLRVLARARIFRNLIQKLPARAARKSFREICLYNVDPVREINICDKFACLYHHRYRCHRYRCRYRHWSRYWPGHLLTPHITLVQTRELRLTQTPTSLSLTLASALLSFRIQPTVRLL